MLPTSPTAREAFAEVAWIEQSLTPHPTQLGLQVISAAVFTANHLTVTDKHKQESRAVTKITARCAQCTGDLKK